MRLLRDSLAHLIQNCWHEAYHISPMPVEAIPKTGKNGRCLVTIKPLRWRHNGCDSVSNHQPHDCLLNRLFRRRSKKTSKLRVTGLCVGNSQQTVEFPAQMASNAENVSIWWRHHAQKSTNMCIFRGMHCTFVDDGMYFNTCFGIGGNWFRKSPILTGICMFSLKKQYQ